MNIREKIRAELAQKFPRLVSQQSKLPAPPRSDPTNIVLGRDPKCLPVPLPLLQRLEHVFVLGATGSGKTSCLLHYMRQAVRMGEGLIFLDPHGDTAYRNLLPCATSVIDFSSSRVVGFNPLACPDDTDPSVIVGNVMDALAVGWEGESFTQKPTIERNLSAIIGALVELRLTLCESHLILDHKDEKGLRRHAIEHVRNPDTRRELQRLHDLSTDGRRKREYDQEIIGSVNRLARLLRPPALRAMLGQTDNCLDIKRILDEQGVLLVNLSGGVKVYNTDADLFGRLVTRTVLFHAERRESTKPVNFVLDEAHRFLSSDIPTLLAEVRKKGVSVVAAMQWLDQADDDILPALMKGPGCKICFRLRDAEESERVARTLMPLNLERPVRALIKPTIVGYNRVKFANESESENQSTTNSRAVTNGETKGHSRTFGETEATSFSRHQSESDTESESQSDTSGTSEGSHVSATEIAIPKDNGEEVITRVTAGIGTSSGASSSRGTSRGTGKNKSHGTTDTDSYAVNRSETHSSARTRAETIGEAIARGTGRSRGFSEGIEPILEERPSAVHSMQNELYAAGLLLRSLPTGVGYLNYVGRNGPVATLFTVPLIMQIKGEPPKLTDGLPHEDALRNIDERHQSFDAPAPTAGKPKHKPRTPQPEHGEPGVY